MNLKPIAIGAPVDDVTRICQAFVLSTMKV